MISMAADLGHSTSVVRGFDMDLLRFESYIVSVCYCLEKTALASGSVICHSALLTGLLIRCVCVCVRVKFTVWILKCSSNQRAMGKPLRMPPVLGRFTTTVATAMASAASSQHTHTPVGFTGSPA